MKEQRVLLTAGRNYTIASKQIGMEQVLEISTFVKAMEQAKYVFKYFNITLDRSTLFSRCVLCNCNNYIIVPPVIITNLIGLQNGQHCNWKKLGESTLLFSDNFNPETGAILKSGKLPIFEGIPASVFEQEQDYFICMDCGKIYWEGGHYDRAIKNFIETDSDDCW